MASNNRSGGGREAQFSCVLLSPFGALLKVALNGENYSRAAIDKAATTKQSLHMQIEREPIGVDRITALLRQHLPSLAEKYHVNSLGVFGSDVRRQQSPESDLDLLVSFDEQPGLLKFIELENYLTDLLGIKVDLVMRDALKPTIGKQILSEVVQV